MTTFKKQIILWLILILTVLTLISMIYLFDKSKNKTASTDTTQILSELAQAKDYKETELNKLIALRDKSYFNTVSKVEYERIKKLVAATDIFFKNANSNDPKIQIRTANNVLATEVNAKRLKINEILRLWENNNAVSQETDKALIREIKNYLLTIDSYLTDLQTIVADLSISNSGLNTNDIYNYQVIIQTGVTTLDQVIANINQAEIVINDQADSAESRQTNNQIEVVKQADITISNLEIILNNLLNSLATSTASTTVTNTPAVTSKVINPQNSSIIYEKKPRIFKDNGVDISNSANYDTPTQDWSGAGN